MNNKGFTLIELLAVIVILAIIALIATPIVLNIINDSRASAIDRTAELVGDEIELAYASFMMNPGDATDTSVDNFCGYMTEDYFQMDGATLGTCANDAVTITVNGTVYTATFDSESENNGSVEIGYDGGNDNTKTVKMRKSLAN